MNSKNWLINLAAVSSFSVMAHAHGAEYWFTDKNIKSHIDQSAKSFLGNESGDYFIPGTLAYSNLHAGLFQAPHEAQPIDSSLQFLSGTHYRDGFNRAAVVTDKNYNVVYAALFNGDCHLAKSVNPKIAEILQQHPERRAVQCTRKTLNATIFTKSATIPNPVIDAFTHWADTAFTSDWKVNTKVVVLKNNGNASP